MTYPIRLETNTGHPEVPNDIVHFDVDVNVEGCGGWGAVSSNHVRERLVALQNEGLDVGISRIVAYSGIYFRGVAHDFWGVGGDRAVIQNAWQSIANWNPRPMQNRHGVDKLVFDRLSNSSAQNGLSELLGVGVGLLVATSLYALPFRFWSPTEGHGRFDYVAPASDGGDFRLEVRGRFNRGGWAAARRQITEKVQSLQEEPSLSSCLGVIFAPRTIPDTRAADIEVMDPEGEGIGGEDHHMYRLLMLHYASFFVRSGFYEFGRRLVELSKADPGIFERYLGKGDEVLRRTVHYRTTFKVGDARFVGAAWDGVVWPAHLLPDRFKKSAGSFLWGVWDAVVDRLIEGRIQEVADMRVAERTSVGEGQTDIVLDDATALSWHSTIDGLLEAP